ncbi:MAG: sigma 54-interacting transcriptional regulator, partial [Planctomycetes bacterium]|nr:sigma 54-interacting transcriptional regulator [Planctomycetota bacterium]
SAQTGTKYRLRSGFEEEEASIVGVSPLFKQVLTVVDAVARNDCVVLLEGESGTGKELLAKRIHRLSCRSDGPFIPVNCPAISETLFESQFCGHVKGAFTGATSDTLGVVRAANGGTLLLDEVGELPASQQPKLLRLLQEREITPVGASKPIPVDTRFVASTNRSLAKSVAEGRFRRDLYYRLNIVRIEVPPLRLRTGDIEPLLDYYLDFYARRYKTAKCVLSSRLRRTLTQYDWPGNIRELCAYVEKLYAAHEPPTAPSPGLWNDGYTSNISEPADMPIDRMPLQPVVSCTLEEVEANAIRRALEITSSNRSAAARMLHIHRSTLLRKMRRFNLK